MDLLGKRQALKASSEILFYSESIHLEFYLCFRKVVCFLNKKVFLKTRREAAACRLPNPHYLHYLPISFSFFKKLG